jgi:protein-arginine deiminase
VTGGSGGNAEFGGIAPDSIVVLGDTDRSGDVTEADLEGRGAFSWSKGAFALANIDDDDDDGASDATDSSINGSSDEADVAELRVELGSELAAGAATVAVSLLEGASHARLFFRDGASLVTAPSAVPALGSLAFGVEATRFAGPDWDGVVRVRVEAFDASGASLASDEAALRVAPWLMLPSSALPETIHVAKGAYANQSFLTDLTSALSDAGVNLALPYTTPHWEEMWMQDSFEIGYAQLPGRAPMHVTLRANRGQDTYPPTLLGPNMGYLVVGAKRNTPGGDAWVDWYGNLEVSPPTPTWPLGRIYYGHNTSTGMMLHPEVVAFLEAQELQSPFWIDTSWLTIKHVDEIITFVPAPDGTPRLLVASPREAGELYPSYYGPYNQGVQAKIDKTILGGNYTIDGITVAYDGVLAFLGLPSSAVLELPIFYTNGHNDWSNPINGVYVGGSYLAGETYIYEPEREVTSDLLASIGIDIVWIDDKVYQDNLGNVHCATNATRTPVVADFVTAIPSGL